MQDNLDNRVTMKESIAAMWVALNANAVLPFEGTKKSLMKLKKILKLPNLVGKLQAEANVEAK